MTISIQAKIYKIILRWLVRPALYSGVDMPSVRQRMEKADALSKMGERGFAREEADINGIPAEWIHTPQSTPEMVLLYFHGGGFCLRTPAMHGQLVANICKKSGVTGLMPDYRLAPEDPFPAAYEDCFDVYRWLLDEGFAPGKIVIAGDSAGGALTLGTLLQARAADLLLPACAVMLSPGIDVLHLPEAGSLQAGPSLSPDSITAFREAFRAHEQPHHPISELLRGDLAGLPTLLLQVGTDELLYNEVLEIAGRAEAAGVPTILEVYEGMPHVFQVNYSLPESKQSVEKIAEFIRQNIKG